jgi:hypothetical protein
MRKTIVIIFIAMLLFFLLRNREAIWQPRKIWRGASVE